MHIETQQYRKSQDEITKNWLGVLPIVSICCPTFNHENYIAQALDGLLMQETNFPFEILVHDDASTDGTTNIIKSYQKKYPVIIKPMYQTVNQYQQGRSILEINQARAQGKYIAGCEGDDYWIDPYKLQKQVDFLESNPEIFVHSTNACVVDKYGKKIKENRGDFYDDFVVSVEALAFISIPFEYRTSIYRNKYYDTITYNLKLGFGDTFLFATFANFGPGYMSKDVTAAYRIHEQGVWSSIIHDKKQIIDSYAENLYKNLPQIIKPELRSLTYFRKLYFCIRSDYRFRRKFKGIICSTAGFLFYLRPKTCVWLIFNIQRLFKNPHSRPQKIQK